MQDAAHVAIRVASEAADAAHVVIGAAPESVAACSSHVMSGPPASEAADATAAESGAGPVNHGVCFGVPEHATDGMGAFRLAVVGAEPNAV